VSSRILDLEGNDVTDCRWCSAIQARDWQTVEYLSEEGVGCTCHAISAVKEEEGSDAS
jgi:hypothetical protein